MPIVLSGKIKRLSVLALKDIEFKNRVRLLNNLPPIEITLRKCPWCKTIFESIGKKQTCGCEVVK